MKIACSADWHRQHSFFDAPKADILVVAGDYDILGNEEQVFYHCQELEMQFEKLKKKYKKIFFIAGNHDFGLEKYNYTGLFKSATYLNDSGATYKKVNFWGSPISPNFNGWAFGKERGDELMAHWKTVPDNTNVLITHGPPYGVLDRLARSQIDVGDYDLLERIKQLKKLKLHVFGHIHEGYGTEDKLGFNCVNASFLNENYICGHNPTIVVDI